MAYVPQTIEELKERYNVKAIPISKEDPEGPKVYFVGIKNKYLAKQEGLWFSQFVVQDLVRRALNEANEHVMNTIVEGNKNGNNAPTD